MDENQTPGPDNTSTQAVNPTVSTETGNNGAEAPKEEGKIEFTETTIMAALSYISVLVFIPFLTKKDNPFILFHVKQGLVVFGLGVIIWAISHILWGLGGILQLIVLILSIIGIINALKMQEKRIPVIGKFADNIKI